MFVLYLLDVSAETMLIVLCTKYVQISCILKIVTSTYF